ncbi:MAG: hypothetical protein ACRD3W_24760 [Terriglobales bacterium]
MSETPGQPDVEHRILYSTPRLGGSQKLPSPVEIPLWATPAELSPEVAGSIQTAGAKVIDPGTCSGSVAGNCR